MAIPFRFQIPAEGPLSYQGKLFAIGWEIFARADLPFAVDETTAASFVVGPALWTGE